MPQIYEKKVNFVDMRDTKFNLIDTSNEEPIEINSLKKNGLTNEVLFNQSEVLFDGQDLQMAYTIFTLQKISTEYKLTYENILVLVYLQELGLFNLKIKVLSRTFNIGVFLDMGYIQVDYTKRGRTLYKLSKQGLLIVQEFYQHLQNTDSYLSSNRVTNIGLDKEMKSTLNGYFS